MKLEPGNIWSGDRKRAVFTNPTELAFRKGNLRNHYPVVIDGKKYADVEEYYRAQRMKIGLSNIEGLKSMLVKGIVAKFQQYPQIRQAIVDSGGEDWIKKCCHFTGARTKEFSRWEGKGLQSAFIECLMRAFQETDA